MPPDRARIAKPLVAGVILSLTVSACAAGGGSGGGQADSLEAMDPVTITVAEGLAQAGLNDAQWTAFADEVEEKSGGKITFDFYWSGSLLTVDKALEGIGDGVADLGMTVVSYSPQDLPVGNWLTQTGPLMDRTFPNGAMQASAAMKELYFSSEALEEEWRNNGVVPFEAISPSMGYDLLCAAPISEPGDVEGRRTATPGASWSAEIEALGMIPVDIPYGERYEALQRGVVDCLVSVPQIWIDAGFWEVAKYVVPGVFSPGLVYVWSMNAELWDSLPVEGQQILRDAGLTFTKENMRGTAEIYQRFATEGPQEHGIEFVDPSGFDVVIDEHQRQVLAGLPESAPSGVDGAAVFNEFESSMGRWLDVTTDEVGLPLAERTAENVLESWATPISDEAWDEYFEALERNTYDQHRPG